jgi:hypothetical protein
MTNRDSYSLQSIHDRLVNQLEWKGPLGKQMGNIVLDRTEATVLLGVVATVLDKLPIRLTTTAVLEKHAELKV